MLLRDVITMFCVCVCVCKRSGVTSFVVNTPTKWRPEPDVTPSDGRSRTSLRKPCGIAYFHGIWRPPSISRSAPLCRKFSKQLCELCPVKPPDSPSIHSFAGLTPPRGVTSPGGRRPARGGAGPVSGAGQMDLIDGSAWQAGCSHRMPGVFEARTPGPVRGGWRRIPFWHFLDPRRRLPMVC